MSDYSRDKYRYITEATNQLMKLLGDADHQSPGALAQAAAQACEALKMLLASNTFKDDLKRWQNLVDPTLEERRNMVRELELLGTVFLKVEKQALIDHGYEANAVDHILWAAAFNKEAAAEKFDQDRILANINALQDLCCSAAVELYIQMDSKKRRKLFSRITFGFGGVALIVVDTVATLPSAGLAAASMTIGGVVVGRSVG